MSADLSGINPEDELDLDGFGLQDFEDDFLITDAGIEERDEGRRWYIELQPTTRDDMVEELINGVARDGGYLNHDERPQLAKIGIGSLKQIFRAVYGRTQGTVAGLKGEMVRAKVTEDDSGFARVRRYRKPQG